MPNCSVSYTRTHARTHAHTHTHTPHTHTHSCSLFLATLYKHTHWVQILLDNSVCGPTTLCDAN